MICAPAFSTAARIRLREYFPEPRIKREVNACPPNINVSLSCNMNKTCPFLCFSKQQPHRHNSFMGGTHADTRRHKRQPIGNISGTVATEIKPLEAFDGVTLLSNSPAPAGEEDLFDSVNNESEVGINNNDYPDCEILEAALYGTRTLDEIMDEWNQKWTAAQESLGVEVNQ